MLQTAGNLATSQSVVNLLQQRTRGPGPNLLNVATLYDATVLVADTLREVVGRDRSKLSAGIDLSSSFIVGGQIAGGAMGIYNVYAQGNFFQPRQTPRSCNWAKASMGGRFWTVTSATRCLSMKRCAVA